MCLLVTALFLWLRSTGRQAAQPGCILGCACCLRCMSYWVLLRVFSTSSAQSGCGPLGREEPFAVRQCAAVPALAYPKLEDLFAVLEKIYPWLVVPVCSLAFAQVLAPADSFLNLQLDRGDRSDAYFGEAGLMRVTGTFSYLSGMAAFVQCTCLLGMALYLGGARSRMFLVGLGFAMAALPVTGSRAVVAVVMVGAAMLLLAALAARVIGLRTVVRVICRSGGAGCAESLCTRHGVGGLCAAGGSKPTGPKPHHYCVHQCI